jgi:hypothetical protein
MGKPRAKKELIYDGIKFDSNLEIYCYKQLKANGLEFVYHKSYGLFPSFKSTVITYDANKNKGPLVYRRTENYQDIEYTTDFEANDGSWIIETKGLLRADAALRIKIFKYFETQKNRETTFLMPHNKKQVDHTIEIIKNELRKDSK